MSVFSVNTLSSWTIDYFSDSFSGVDKISDSSNITIDQGQATLEDIGGQYESSGYLVSINILPGDLINWEEFSWNDNELANTQITYQVLYFDGENWFLIPDAALPGNSSGFGASPLDLSGLNVGVYGELKIKANLSTGDTALTPILYDWQISWKTTAAVSIPNVTFHLQGEKIIGKDEFEEPIYEYSEDHVSDGSGQITISDLEWDSYTFSVDPLAGLDLKDINPYPQPIGLSPDVTLSVNLYLEAQNSVFITVQDDETEDGIFSAEVRLFNSGLGYDVTQYTDEQGETYFIPLDSAVYNVEIEGPGCSSYSGTISVSGYGFEIINLQRIE